MERKIARKSLNGDGEHGSRSTDDINEEDMHKNSHWKVGMSHNWIETFFAIFTAIYFLIVYMMYASTWEKLASLKYLGWTIVLTLLPFYRVRQITDHKCKYRKYLNIFTIRSLPIRVALSSLALLVPVVFLESYLGEQNLLVLYFSLTIFFRLIDSRSLYDCAALCIVYSVDFQGLPNLYGRIWFTTTRLLLWVCLFLGVLCGSVLRRSTFRIWEHIRLLIIFRKKSKQERVFSNFIASAHFSPDLLDAAIKRRDLSPESQKRLEKSPYGDLESPYEPSIVYSTAIAESASEAGILFSFNLKPILSLEKIKSLDGLERKLASVIAFKLIVSDDRECCMNSQAGHMMHDLLDMLATRQKISCVRKFGDTWVGCIGLHRGWENNRKDSYHAILMGCEAMVLAKRMQLQLCCAVESGKIDAGFVGCSNYDVFGPEIRWVLNMVEAKKHGHVLVGNSARNLNTRSKTFDPESAVSVHFGRTVIDSIWKTKQECEKVHSVYKLSDLVTDEESLIQDFLDADNTVIKNTVGVIPTMSWQAVQGILDGSDRPNLNSKPVPERTWDEEIACELQMSVEERFGMSLNDTALQGMSEEDLEELHVEIEASIRSIMVEHFFGSFFRLLILLSPAKYRNGVNDQVVPASSLHLSDESQEFLSPVESILSGIPFTRSWFAPDSKAKQKRFEDTDVSLREKIKKEAVSHLIVASGSSKSVKMTSARDSIKSIAKGHRSNNLTNRLPNLPLPSGLSRRNTGAVHPCLFKDELDISQHHYGRRNTGSVHPCLYANDMDTSQHLYGGECKYEYDDNIRVGPRMSTRTLFSGEFSNHSQSQSQSQSQFIPQFQSNQSQTNPTNQDMSLSSSISRFVQYKPQGSIRSKHLAPPSVLKQKSVTGTLKGSSDKYHEFEESPVKIDLPGRGLEKYTSDARSMSNAYIGVCFCLLVLYAVLLCIVDTSYMYQVGAVKPSYIFGFLALNCLFLNLTERKYDRIVCVVLFILRSLVVVAVMPYLAGDSNVFTEGDNIKYLEGNALLILGLWFPIALRQSFLFNCLELVLHILSAMYVRHVTHLGGHRTLRVATTRMLPVIVFFLIIFWAIEYLCIISYVIENILVPEAQTLYQREYVHAREMLHACSPNIPLDKRQLYCPRRYRSCSILAIHVKAADVLPGLVDALSVASFMKEIMLLMDGCVKECGLLKVTHFSGVFIAACPDLIDDNTPINYMTRAVMCLRKIQTKLDAFSRRNSVNVSIGAGLSCGSVTMGLLGNTRFCFDVSGAARDLAIFMASHQNDGIYALESFGPHFRDGQLSDDLVVREVTVTAGHKTMKWLQLDGAFNKGMQLDDFEYMCMLGRGGFGSVHLLWENATEKEYAIKAIPRKKGSAIPKMIQREFIILQQIQHANVVSFKCCIINKAMIYLVMSYVRGGNLKQIVERNKPDLKHLTLWFAELVLALNYIHSLGIIHRDVKPANCMIDASGHLKLADFGLSKIVSPTTSSGFDPSGSLGEEDYRNASATVAINLIKSILPLKSNMSEGEVHLPERSVQILLIDFNLMSSSAKRLKEMYFKVTSVSSSVEAKEAIAQATFKAEIILVDLDSVNMSDPTSTMSCGLALLQDLALKSKNIPIIGLSSIDDRDLRRKIISAGAREVLSLPIHKASRDTLLKYGRLYHHLNKPQRSKSFHMIPSLAIEKEPDSKGEDTNQGTALHSTQGAEDAAERTAHDEEPEGGLTSAILPSSLVGNTSCYSHATSGTERMDTPNTMTDPKAQVWSAHTAAKRVVSEGQQKHSAVGTIHFMAPEVIFEHKYGRSVDWWACGVTFYECTVRQHLFTGLEKEVIMQQILSGPIDLEPLSQYSSPLQNLVAGLLVRNPNLRLGTEGGHTIMRQDFFRGIDWNTISDSVPNYKPAQHVNQRHSVEDKMLFYGEVLDKKTEHNRRVDSTLEEYRRAALAKEGRGAPGASASRSKKRHCKNLNMRQRKEDFQKLTDKRKSWVSGNHLLSEIDGGKKVATFNAAYQGKQAGPRVGMFNTNNPTAPGTGIGRSGIMNASLDWSITMLPEGDSEEGKVDDDEEEDDEHKQLDLEVQDLDDSVSACASADYEAHPSDDDQDGSESPVDPTVIAVEGDGDGEGGGDGDGDGDVEGESECESECDSPNEDEGESDGEGDTEGDGDIEVEVEVESGSPAVGTDSQAKEERKSTLL